MNWLASTLGEMELTERVEGYLLGRGARPETITATGCVTWQRPEAPVADKGFQMKYGAYGEELEGYLITPLQSPRGALIGFEARSIREKLIEEFLLPAASWNPVFLGLRLDTMQRIWNGADVWMTEGQFDLYPLEWIVPAGDVVLASLRAKLADKHIEFLRRFCTGWVNMVYDLDTQGRKATHGWVDENGKARWGALKRLGKVNISCRDVPYAGGKDPGEVWERGGVGALRSAFSI